MCGYVERRLDDKETCYYTEEGKLPTEFGEVVHYVHHEVVGSKLVPTEERSTTLKCPVCGGENPQWEHDCAACEFLGRWKEFDLYYCRQRGIPTVIARWSDEGQDYYSGLVFASAIPALGVAEVRAAARGCLNDEEDEYNDNTL